MAKSQQPIAALSLSAFIRVIRGKVLVLLFGFGAAGN
jgi:hypothetical protein